MCERIPFTTSKWYLPFKGVPEASLAYVKEYGKRQTVIQQLSLDDDLNVSIRFEKHETPTNFIG